MSTVSQNSAPTVSDVKVYGALSGNDSEFFVNDSTPEVCVTTTGPADKPVVVKMDVVSPDLGETFSQVAASGDEVCYVVSDDAGLEEGKAEIVVETSDSDGAVGSTESITIDADYTPPTVPLLSGGTLVGGKWSNPANVSTTFYGDSAAEWGYVLDGGEYQKLSSSKLSLPGLSAGFHHLWVVSTDSAGNYSMRSTGFGVGQNPSTPCEPIESGGEGSIPLADELNAQKELTPFTKDYIKCHSSEAGKIAGPKYVSMENELPAGNVIETSLLMETADELYPDVNEPAGDYPDVEPASGAGESVRAGSQDMAAAAVRCKTDTRKSGTVLMFTYTTKVRFCYDGRKVSGASTSRSWTKTTAGNIAGYRLDLWDDPPIKWYYTLNGVGNAAYRYTQRVVWSMGRPHGIQCDSTHTQRVYGSGKTKWAWNKKC